MVSEFGLAGIAFFVFVLFQAVSRRATIWHVFLLMAIASRAVKLGSWVDYGMPIFLISAFYLGSRPALEGDVSRGRVGTID